MTVHWIDPLTGMKRSITHSEMRAISVARDLRLRKLLRYYLINPMSWVTA